MATTHLYPTSATHRGPWIVAAEDLSKLDEILEDFKPRIEKRRVDLVAREVEETVSENVAGREARGMEVTDDDRAELKRAAEERLNRSYRFQPFTAEVIAELGDGSRVKGAESIEEAASQPEAQNSFVKRLTLTNKCAGLECHLELETTAFGAQLEIKCGPEDEDLARELFGKLNNWAIDRAQPRWQSWWLTAMSFGNFFLWMLWLGGSVLFWIPSKSVSDPYRVKAQEMVSKGVTPQNQAEAIQTLLAMEAGIKGPVVETRPGAFSIAAWVGATFCVVVLSFPPKLVIGIGRGRQRVRRWRLWLRFLSVGLPTFIMSAVLAPLIRKKLGF